MPKFELPKLPKVDLAKVEVPKPVYAGAGVADIVVETYKEYSETASKRVAEVQKSVTSFEPKTIPTKAGAQLKSLTADAKARRTALEARVSELQAEAKALPGKATDTYEGLAKRGERLIGKLRRETAAAVAPEGQVVKPAEKPAAKKAPAKKAPAKKAPAARKTTTRKTTTTRRTTATKTA